MSRFTDAFDRLYDAQTRNVGIAIVATITGFGANKPALLSGVNQNQVYIPGSTAEQGGYMLQIKQGDLSAEPSKGTSVTCNGSATGTVLQVTSAALVNGIWEITVGDINA